MKDGQVRRLSGVHRGLYRLTGGRLGNRLVGNDMLLLTTVGRRSGRHHTVPLLFLREGGTLVVVASYGGRDRHPAWYLNLVAEPEVRVQLSGRRIKGRARTAEPGSGPPGGPGLSMPTVTMPSIRPELSA